jgi:hypothetical protein
LHSELTSDIKGQSKSIQVCVKEEFLIKQTKCATLGSILRVLVIDVGAFAFANRAQLDGIIKDWKICALNGIVVGKGPLRVSAR